MKKLFTILFILVCSNSYAAKLQVPIKVLVYDCSDGYEYVIHNAGDSYEHTCEDNTVINNASTVIDNVTNYSSSDFKSSDILAILSDEKLSETAQKKILTDAIAAAEKFITDRDNAPEPETPSIDDYKALIDSRLNELYSLTNEMEKVEDATSEDWTEIKNNVEEKYKSVVNKIKNIGDITIINTVSETYLAGDFIE